jgi:hypothetical protein
LEVGGVEDKFIIDIYTSRLQAFGFRDEPYLPITAADFQHLYDILANNLRSLLGHTDEYCQWVCDHDLPQDEDQKTAMFQKWLSYISEKAFTSARAQLRPRAWEIFEKALSIGGAFSPSEYKSFDCNSIQGLRPHVRDLESVGLVVSTQDEGDKRRRTVQVTPKGWLVKYAKGVDK